MTRPRPFVGRWTTAGLAAVALAGAGAPVGAPLAGCLSCRTVAATPLAIECAPSSTFRGELHFSDASAFRSFLTDRCLVAAATADDLVAAVDFDVDGVFVARGLRAARGRCVEERAVDDVSVCVDGLRVAFRDEVSNDAVCAGDWTIALALARAELRAALADDTVDATDEPPVPG